MVKLWGKEEYSHGPLMPIMAIFFIWQAKDQIEEVRFNGAIAGILILILGLALGMLGNLSTIFYKVIQHIAFLIALAGITISIVGWRGLALIGGPLAILIFMIPLPDFFYFELSGKLQLISSAIGVEVIRLFGISVFLEGNVIDLGDFKLQVVEACSGLRYVFSLLSIGFICAYLYKAPFWQRAILFLSTVPITVFMNSFRIGVIGVLVDRWGQKQAEGFLHDFEGWVIFVTCLAILFLEMFLLNKLFGKEKRPLREVFGMEFPEPSPANVQVRKRRISKPFIVSVIILAVALVVSLGVDKEVREEIVPDRLAFSTFPDQLGEWRGKKDQLDAIFLDALVGLSDHVITDYVNAEGKKVNFYAAYYESQQSGKSVHSPKRCIPGGGWDIENIRQVTLDTMKVNGKPVVANRVEIAKGDHKQLVYYWFQQRGRVFSDDYMMRWYLILDSLTKNRTDGALVRLVVNMDEDEDWAAGDELIKKFTQALGDELSEYVPE